MSLEPPVRSREAAMTSAASMSREKVTAVEVTRIASAARATVEDAVAIEEPLEIRAAWFTGDDVREKVVSVLMRTPGDDLDLAAGFLFSEGLVSSASEIDAVRHWGSPNCVRVALKQGARVDTSRIERHFFSTSGCGVCGKTSLDAVRASMSRLPDRAPLDRRVVASLPLALQSAQSAFHATGGVHGAAIIDANGTLQRAREDIGRHNAVDKVLGTFVREGTTPPDGSILMVSSRGSFEIVQKAIVAGISTLAFVGGPSSLAIELAREFNLTLLGWVREERFNVYSGEVV